MLCLKGVVEKNHLFHNITQIMRCAQQTQLTMIFLFTAYRKYMKIGMEMQADVHVARNGVPISNR